MANNNFDLTNLALQCICPNNELIYDDVGKPSVMVKIPKMTYAQLGLGSSTDVFPAFIVDGVTKDYIYISKYQNIVVNSRAYSLPAKDPKTSITFDQAIAACTAKGAGWHLMTKTEWALLAWWCKKNNTMPYGNNNYGKDTRESVYYAIPTSLDSGKTGRVATGTGPLTWSHDRSPAGIWDLNGNVWEWTGGVRTVYGEVQLLANNNAADKDNSQAANSALWMAINADDGSLITPNGSGTTEGSVKMDYVSNHVQYSTTITSQSDSGLGCQWNAVTCDSTISDAARLVLASIITIQSTPKAYGHYTLYDAWSVDGDKGMREINIGAGTLSRPIENVVATLLHEMCHYWNDLNGVKDCSRGNTYHNRKFKELAEACDLHIEHHPTYGWSITSPSDELLEFCIDNDLREIRLCRNDADFSRVPGTGTHAGTFAGNGGFNKKSSTRKYVCPCCGMSVRATRNVNIACLDCEEQLVLVA